MDRMKAASKDKGYCTSPTWPSLSTINPDVFESSSPHCVPSLQVSGVESEIVSSSSNLRKIIQKNKSDKCKLPIQTSSVKQFIMNNFDKDTINMPPPSNNFIFSTAKKRNSLNLKHNKQEQQIDKKELDNNDCSSLVQVPAVIKMQHDNSSFKSDFHESKGLRTFSCWKVLLNIQKQLVIKGTLECGKIGRSKPIEQRLTSHKVQSIFKHVYSLSGNIVDDKKELPDYVREKFYNGFPDDWENVVQLWKNYISEGSTTFRWPTRISDSDDDLNSEITDFTYCKSKVTEHKELSCKTLNSNFSSGYHTKFQSDSNHCLDKSKDNIDQNVSQCMSKNIQKECDCENSNKYNFCTNNSNLKNLRFLYEIIREDKIGIVLSNLGDKNCPTEYLDKFIDLIDCSRYLLSYSKANDQEAETSKQNLSQNKSQIQFCKKCNSTASLSEAQEIYQEKPSTGLKRKNESKELEEFCTAKRITECSVKTKTREGKENNESSDSDTYMGIANVSLHRLIKRNPPRPQRYRDAKNRSKLKKQSQKVKQISNHEQNNPVQDRNQYYDSSVSLTENESERQNEERVGNRIIVNEKNKCTEDRYSELHLPSPTNRIIQNPPGKHKPVIKSCEPVCFNLRNYVTKNKISQNSDISFIDDESSIKKQTVLNSYNNANKNPNDRKNKNLEDREEDISKHPFLYYDSEDFLDEEEMQIENQLQYNSSKENSEVIKIHKMSSSRTPEKSYIKKHELQNIEQRKSLSPSAKNKSPIKNKKMKTATYGSKENPKLLISWVPCVMYNDESKKTCSLSFEGKLLNEAGHIIHRKFTTNPIYTRHSSRLLETVNNEYFLLSGELNASKHALPKDLLKHCRTGCPSKIVEFCEEWINFQSGELTKRKSPRNTEFGNNKKNNLLTKMENPETQLNLPRIGKNKETDVRTEKGATNSLKSVIPHIVQKLRYSSSYSSESEDNSTNLRTLRSHKMPLNDNPLTNVHGKEKSLNPGKQNIKCDMTHKNPKDHKRKKFNSQGNREKKKFNTRLRIPSTKKSSSAVTWTYEQEEQYFDVLSGDQSSVVK